MKNSISKELIEIVTAYVKCLPGRNKDGDCYSITQIGWPSPVPKFTLRVMDYDKNHRHAHLEAILKKCGITISSLPEECYGTIGNGSSTHYTITLPIQKHTGDAPRKVDIATMFSRAIRNLKNNFSKLQAVKFPVTPRTVAQIKEMLDNLNKDISNSLLSEAMREFNMVKFNVAVTTNDEGKSIFELSSEHTYKGTSDCKPIQWLISIDRLYSIAEALGIKWQFQHHTSSITDKGSKLLFTNITS